MQERLPQMGAAALDESDLGEAALAELVAKAGDKLEARCASAHHDDAMGVRRKGDRLVLGFA
jgi:hypothetical protein